MTRLPLSELQIQATNRQRIFSMYFHPLYLYTLMAFIPSSRRAAGWQDGAESWVFVHTFRLTRLCPGVNPQSSARLFCVWRMQKWGRMSAVTLPGRRSLCGPGTAHGRSQGGQGRSWAAGLRAPPLCGAPDLACRGCGRGRPAPSLQGADLWQENLCQALHPGGAQAV